MLKFIFFLIVSLSASLLRPDKSLKDFFIVWNVGQGQWTTLVTENYCDHFDIGGEFHIARQVLARCNGRQHRLHLSHWDWDHMSELKSFRKMEIPICLWNTPIGEASDSKKELLAGLAFCESRENKFQVIFKGDSALKATSNDTCEVVQLKNGILIPGDSTIKEEKKWTLNPALLKALGLVLGHHGSRTSTSDLLLHHLPKLRWAVATARKNRYGHPHPEVLQRLRKNKTPVLLTEDWGSIVFEL